MTSDPIPYDLGYRPSQLNSIPSLIAIESKRLGGVSPPPFNSLNLGLNTTDTAENIEANRYQFFKHIGFSKNQVCGAHQVHGCDILFVNQAGIFEGFDALITDKKNLLLTITVADCTPILIYDKEHKAIAAIHAGWRGTVEEIAIKTLQQMNLHFQTQAENCLAFIGTCIDECSFEVDADVADHFHTSFKRWNESKQKFFVDLKSANEEQLLQSGIPKSQIEISPFSTVTHNQHYFSYRKENGQTGRMLAAIGIRS